MKRLMSFAICLLVLTLAFPAWGQRADRGTITGVVSDPTGNAIPRATVKVRNDDTGVMTDVITNEAGVYATPTLVLGTYTVTAEVTGFKTAVRQGIRLVGGQNYREDITMELGSVSDQVTVTASAEMLNTANADVTHAVDSTYYHNLPVVMGADIRLAEALLQLQPGYNPMKPNGDPMFRGSQFQSRLNGGQKSAMENFFDGVAFGYASGHNQSHESAPPIESVGEMKVITSTFSAQYGHSSGGTVEYTSKAGTKDLHGSFYEYFANDKLNAHGFFPDRASKQRNNAFGFTVGGPVYIPKVYDGRNKTFFFTNFDWLKFRAGVLPGFGNTTPIDAFKAGDFSALVGARAGTDAMGRDVFNGQIFDPNSTRTVNNVPIRDAFVGNRIPASLRSNVANQLTALMVRPDRPGTALNVAGNPAGDQTWIGDFRTIMFRVDHQWNDKFKTATSFFWPKRPSIRNCGEVGGCNFKYDPRVSPEKNTDYIGNGFYQRIATQHANQQFDYIIKNNLLYHATVSWDRWFMGGTPISGYAGWQDRLWGTDKSGLLDKTAGPPNMTFTNGNIPYTQIGMQWTGFGFEAINRWQFVNDLTWVAGKHSIKVGYEFRLHQFNFHGWAASTGGSFNFRPDTTSGFDQNGNRFTNTGDPFASFLLGQVYTANFLIPAFTTFNGKYMSAYLNDDYKVTSKLNLTLGIRFDYQGPWTERFDRFSSFDPKLPNPQAGGRLGALAFAGTGPGRTGKRTFDDIPLDAWGPRFGFAYKFNDRMVLRGGYGIYYAGVTFGQGGTPIIGFQSNPTVANLSNGLSPAFKLDDGFPRDAIKIPNQSFIDPSFANTTAPVAYPADGLKQPRYQNWSVTFQRQLTNSMVLEASYIGNHGTRLPHHPWFLGTAFNVNDPKVLALGSAVLSSDINSAAARNAGITSPYPGFAGNVAQALRPYPQYQTIEYRDVPIGKSKYDSFQINLDKRFSNGLQFRTFYVRARLLNNRAESGQRGGGTVQNPLDANAEWGLSEDDVPHAFNFTTTYELPFGKNKHGFLGKLLQGWTLNGVLRYDSGRPLVITMNNDMGGLLFNGVKRPDRLSSVDGVGNLDNFDPNKSIFFNKAGWQDPGPLKFGNAPARDPSVRGFMNAVEDVSIFKVTSINERFRVRLEAQGGNVTNRTVFCDPGITGSTNWNSGSFGTVALQCNQPRSVQFGLKFEY